MTARFAKFDKGSCGRHGPSGYCISNAPSGSLTVVLNVTLATYDSRVSPVESTMVRLVKSPMIPGGENAL